MSNAGQSLTLACALHVHSTWSDGEFTLPQLRQVFLREGVSLVALADHDYSFTDDTVAEYVAECARFSDENFLFVPGLEFECDERMHIVGYGVTTLGHSAVPENAIAHIERCGGVSMIAHPKDDHFARIEQFALLPIGLEVWNSKYDGRYAPRARTFALFHRLRQRRADMRAFYGQDLHWRKQFRGMITHVTMRERTRESFLSALVQGNFYAQKGSDRFPSNGEVDAATLARLDESNVRSRTVWMVLKRLAGGMGRYLPAPIKSQLRRFF